MTSRFLVVLGLVCAHATACKQQSQSTVKEGLGDSASILSPESAETGCGTGAAQALKIGGVDELEVLPLEGDEAAAEGDRPSEAKPTEATEQDGAWLAGNEVLNCKPDRPLVLQVPQDPKLEELKADFKEFRIAKRDWTGEVTAEVSGKGYIQAEGSLGAQGKVKLGVGFKLTGIAAVTVLVPKDAKLGRTIPKGAIVTFLIGAKGQLSADVDVNGGVGAAGNYVVVGGVGTIAMGLGTAQRYISEPLAEDKTVDQLFKELVENANKQMPDYAERFAKKFDEMKDKIVDEALKEPKVRELLNKGQAVADNGKLTSSVVGFVNAAAAGGPVGVGVEGVRQLWSFAFSK